jgi:DNA-binding IscR family transcriptional regulator
MRLTSFTDYTLRSLIFLGMNRDKLVRYKILLIYTRYPRTILPK